MSEPLTNHGTSGDSPPSSTLRDGIALVRSILGYLIISLYVLVAGPVAIVLMLVFRREGCLFVPGRTGAWLALRSLGIRYVVVGRELVPLGPVVFCVNHQSNVDPPVVFLAVGRRVRMLYKIEFDKVPILSSAIRLAKFVAVDRHNRAQATRAIERAAALIRDGLSFITFPEGTRSPAGELLPFKKGGFIMAIRAQAPIVPVAISGARSAMRKGSAIVHPVRVSVRIGPVVPTRGRTVDDRAAVMTEVRKRIEGLLAEGPIR